MKKYLILIALEIAMFAVEAAFYNKVLAAAQRLHHISTGLQNYKKMQKTE